MYGRSRAELISEFTWKPLICSNCSGVMTMVAQTEEHHSHRRDDGRRNLRLMGLQSVTQVPTWECIPCKTSRRSFFVSH